MDVVPIAVVTREPAVRRCLILANQTLTSETLGRAVRERIAAEPHEFYIVAAASPPANAAEGSGAHADTPSLADQAYALASQRLVRALEELRALGATVDGAVGDPDPVDAVLAALKEFPADEVVVSTLPHALSHWLRRDVPGRLRKACEVPVTHVMADS